ncbi:DNA-directed RNA polymerase III subunit RPC9 [Daktulosphaira vitifoliae]|uniref:DNA-directed RNA polymerase III subunit RPC9 n=1 Tax=Daktulosphaira vitifoliae TaxID=58002 RepID=UPI0021AA565A|nr:DNA-directed RNA polymerase III subunit RPC9 [Daktulosphaira vitifoliae]
MEVKNPQVAVLSNYEAFQLLKKAQENNKLIGGMSHSTILYEVFKHLEHKPCAGQSESKIKEFLMQLRDMPINLTKKEKLMLVNDPPDTILQLSLIIKDFYDRLSEQETELLLNASKTFCEENSQFTTDESNVDLAPS